MEKLKSAIPLTLFFSISQSNLQNLPNTCSYLHDFFNQLPQFHQMIEDLTHTNTSLFLKNEESALEFKLKGNNCFSNGDYSNTLKFYTQALRVAPRDVDVMGKNLVATLYVNRAAVLQKMSLFLESLRDCNRALAICKSYSKAWYRRGKANTSMGNYDDAVCDLKVSICMERSSSGKRQIESELKLILAQNKKHFDVIKRKESDIHGNTRSSVSDQLKDIQLQCVETETKGRGMVSLTNIPQSTLLHAEEPYAAIIQKNCSESHCHYCFKELPADIVPCSSCSMALYCSQLCQIHARGQNRHFHTKNHDNDFDLSSDLENYVSNVTKPIDDSMNVKQYGEHKHECGVNWPAALPAVHVLAGRVIIKSVKQNRLFVNLDLCHNYVHLDPEAKLELLISSIVLLKCLHHRYRSDISLNGETISQCVLLLSQILVNHMAIVVMRSADSDGPQTSAGNHTTSIVEQVRVGHALYLAGSLYNHSCKPNVHTYFVSRTLYIRAIDFVAAGHPLEISYGPQVGEWSCDKRQSTFKDQYSFVCSCTACSQLNLPDLVISSYRCSNKECLGVVLDKSVVNYEQRKVNPFLSGSPLQVDRVKHDELKKVARFLCEETGSTHRAKPRFCLSCGASIDLVAAVRKMEIFVDRLDGFLDSGECFDTILSDNLRHLDLLKSALHPYNKQAAEAEDYIAQVFCSIGELQRSRDHCEASIKILEKLYCDEHIVIGNELVKLASIQLSLGEKRAVEETRKRIGLIFKRHYGSHVDDIFPHLQFLKKCV